MNNCAALHVVMYHYVRDLTRTKFPRLKAMPLDAFRAQVPALQQRFEMASLESALSFLAGRYRPDRDLCLLTFDDGLREHYTEVTPLLAERRIQGVFLVIGSALEGHGVAPVHMNHFLMAGLDFDVYRALFLEELADRSASPLYSEGLQSAVAERTYPWDTREVACFKYFFNFTLDARLRDEIVRELFREYISDEASFARSLYLSPEEARLMQGHGMVLGGHSHWHRPLAGLDGEQLQDDLARCRGLLDRRLRPQQLWPFSYPYGKPGSYTSEAASRLKELGFVCSFSTEDGTNKPGGDPFAIRRVDCKLALQQAAA